MYDPRLFPAVPSPTRRLLPAVSPFPSDFTVSQFLDDFAASVSPVPPVRPLALVDDAIVGVIRAMDDNATDGAHDCLSESGVRDYWCLTPEDVPALLNGGEPNWTVLPLCPACRVTMERDGWYVQRTASDDSDWRHQCGVKPAHASRFRLFTRRTA